MFIFAFSLHYYNDGNFRDYSPIQNANTWTRIQGQGTLSTTSKGFVSLYNGNIAAMATHIGTPQGQPQGSYGNQLLFYQYDQLNRIKNANRVTNSNNNNYAANRIENYAFDANGNITTLQRTRMNGNVANAAQRIDNLSYNYNTTDNKLAYIADNASNAADTDDLKNQAANNYTYDEIGNLTQDLEGKNKQVFWTAYGKVSKVIKATNDSILYRYDATGQRISKTFKDKTTFYVRDASGNVMATYEQTTTTTTVKEINIYGSSRVGTYNGKSARNKEVLGNKNYELSNHLGNVLVTITDNKFIETTGVFIAKVNSTTDYYPFGMAIKERTWKSTEYRYGFNTQEKDFDIDESGNHTTAEFWEYDSRSGRRWNVDPVVKEFESPYACLGNSPIWMIDVLGNDAKWIPSIQETGGKKQVVLEKESGDNEQTLNQFFGGAKTKEEVKKLYNSMTDNKVVLKEYNGIVNMARMGNCMGFATSFVEDKEPCNGSGDGAGKTFESIGYMTKKNGGKIAQFNSYDWTDYLANSYNETSADASDVIFGKTLIRFAFEEGEDKRTLHACVFFGRSQDGTIYVITVNGVHKPAKIMTLDALIAQHGETVDATGLMTGYGRNMGFNTTDNTSGFFNPKKGKSYWSGQWLPKSWKGVNYRTHPDRQTGIDE